MKGLGLPVAERHGADALKPDGHGRLLMEASAALHGQGKLG
jgi:hypothetical protein